MYSQYSVVYIVSRLHSARTRFVSRHWLDILFLSKMFGSALGLTKLPCRWVRGAFAPVVNWPGREADSSLPFLRTLRMIGEILKN